MKITQAMQHSVPFQYANEVLSGKLVVGLRIRQACERFYKWIDEADEKGYYLDHSEGMKIINSLKRFYITPKEKRQENPLY